MKKHKNTNVVIQQLTVTQKEGIMNQKFDQLINEITNENNQQYTVAELLDELIKDASWESDPRKRMQTVMMLKHKLENA